MDYPLENLGPEKFQEFCQSLLTREFDGVQCFPVGQPDGGRDAIRFYGPGTKFVVFQVKFVRNPQKITEPHKWLEGIIKDELPKLKKLIPRGAMEYVLISNVPGTAHLDNGSIDKVQGILDSISIPSHCWWRDDICRRLDNAWDLKWIFPEIMTGSDLLHALLEAGLNERKEIRTNAIRAFMQDQFDKDMHVKFKQIELQDELLDLFIDVPMRLSAKSYESSFMLGQKTLFLQTEDFRVFGNNRRHGLMYADQQDQEVDRGAATFLLSRLIHEKNPKIILEGAPGQGKSTIMQYICQIYRIKLLSKKQLLHKISDSCNVDHVALPIKIDLRDFAKWLTGKNPFSPIIEVEGKSWPKTLESFIAFLISYHSGGTEFKVEDLHAIAKGTSLLIVLDGLDEVADHELRKNVVEEIRKGVNRLGVISLNLQTILTSRPAVFDSTHGLPSDEYICFQLDSLTRETINEYADKWLSAKNVDINERPIFKRTLEKKMGQPHLRDLARNTMQLAILLSLIHTRGVSLPDKRTSLYDSYMDLFFNRESEKSPIVRDHRDLLRSLHMYLAWILHSRAETKEQNDGSISEAELHDLVKIYLEKEGHDVELAEKLFKGMVERVVAIVSRVQGRYEFEVQPLREYFTARYLYETAPYSPAGNVRKGTLPERFKALAQNPYWLNVTRFYAGCYNRGELASLIEVLREIICTDEFGLIRHPKLLAVMLLSDWVFTQHPRSVSEVVSIVSSGSGLKSTSINLERYVGRNHEPMVLPDQCGRHELLEKCYEILFATPPSDYAKAVISIIKANSNAKDINKKWLTKMQETAWNNNSYVKYGLHLGCIETIDISNLNNVLEKIDDKQKIELLFKANRFDYLENNEDCYSESINTCLNRSMDIGFSTDCMSSLDFFHVLTMPCLYASGFRGSYQTWGLNPEFIDKLEEINFPKYAMAQKCKDFLYLAKKVTLDISGQSHKSLLPWNNLIEKMREAFGENLACCQLANISSSIKSKKIKCGDHSNLLDNESSLCYRVRYARLHSGAIKWWREQLDAAKDKDEELFVLLILLTWGTSRTLTKLAGIIDAFVKKMSFDDLEKLKRLLVEATRETGRRYLGEQEFKKIVGELSIKTAILYSCRLRDQSQKVIFDKFFKNYKGSNIHILNWCQDVVWHLIRVREIKVKSVLNLMSINYLKGASTERRGFYSYARGLSKKDLDMETSREIVRNSSKYPAWLVFAAESICENMILRKFKPLHDIAIEQEWFSDED